MLLEAVAAVALGMLAGSGPGTVADDQRPASLEPREQAKGPVAGADAGVVDEVRPADDGAGHSRPIKAKVWSDSGRVLKVIYYRAFEERLGAVRPTEVVIIDSVDAALVTTARLDAWAWDDIPESWFQREALAHLPPE